jgi:hypothetical protein
VQSRWINRTTAHWEWSFVTRVPVPVERDRKYPSHDPPHGGGGEVSYQGQTWVDEVAHPHLKNSGELIIMLRVANHAGNGPNKMSGCFAGAPLLAEESILSLRAAQGTCANWPGAGSWCLATRSLSGTSAPTGRPQVYDLAGAHRPGCPGGHDIDGECLPSPAGGKNCYPWQEKKPAGQRVARTTTRPPRSPPRVAKNDLHG